jgi:hypothetical protein
MAHPWVFESNFEAGTNAEWDSESDTGSKLDFPHYTTLAAIPGLGMPYKGAYCMRVDLRSGDTNDHTLTEGDIDIADAATRHFAFALFVSSNFTATADDTFNILELQQSGGTIECSMGMRITAATNALDIGIGDGIAPTSFVGFPRGRWVIVEWSVAISTGGSGTSTLFLDGAQVVALTSQTHAAAVGQGVLGTQNTLSTTTGTILFDRFIMDDARVYPPNQRFPDVVRLTKSAHAFVGPGCISSATLLSATGTMDVWDTDTANTNDASSKRIQLDASANFVSNDSVTYFERGCYVALSGTNPVAEIKLSRKGGSECGPTAYGSEGAIRTYAARRLPRPLNV